MDKDEGIWQDREIRFDVDHKLLRITNGETTIARVDHVEDTKGNNGGRGMMKITNLRLIWFASSMPRINITIGWNCITGVQTRQATSSTQRRGGSVEAIYVLAKVSTAATKFEFIFTTTSPKAHSKLFTMILSLNRTYETTTLYRELKLRGSFITDDGSLRLLPEEVVCEHVKGVWNLSEDQANLGQFIITNCRVVWFAELNSMYNVSIPYLTLRGGRIRDSKFGTVLILETNVTSGEYVVGFRIDPIAKLHATADVIRILHKTQTLSPIFGVTFNKERAEKEEKHTDEVIDNVLHDMEDDVEIDMKGVRSDPIAAYYNGEPPRENSEKTMVPVFSSELGLAIEPLHEGFTIDALWTVNFH